MKRAYLFKKQVSMKITSITVVLFIAAAFFFTACDDDDAVAKPAITILELGSGDSHGNEHSALVGGELHIEADIIAEGKIDKINIRLHPEGEDEHSVSEDGWELDTTYTKFAGLKNTLFHEHVDIDPDAEPGVYHFDFVVTDMEGNQSNAEAEVVITK